MFNSFMLTSLYLRVISSALPALTKSHILLPFTLRAEYIGGNCLISPLCVSKAFSISSMLKSLISNSSIISPDES